MRSIGILTALFMFVLSAAPATAQDPSRVWDTGTVWTVSYIKTKPGKFNDYIKDLNGLWKVFQNERIKEGDVVSYKILRVDNPRDGEPDLILMVEVKNNAVFDRPIEEFEKRAARLMGDNEKFNQAGIDREALRSLRGSLLATELHFKE